MGNEHQEDIDELAVLMKVLDIVRLRIEKRELYNHESIQLSQIINQFLPGTTIGNLIQDGNVASKGDIAMGDKYEAHGHAQVGAMGKGAKVRTVTFGTAADGGAQVDLATLLSELQSLRAEMRSQASTTENDLAVVAVGQAISAGEEGDTSGMLKYLKTSGKWAWDLATAIGAGVAAGVIKSAMGL